VGVTSAIIATVSMAVLLITGGNSIGVGVAGHSQGKPAATGLLAILEKSGYSYSKVTDGVYEVPATGKNLKQFPLRLTQADDVLVVIAKLADRKDVTINQAVAQKLLELNDDFDVVKFALSDEMLYARIDIHVRLVDAEEMKYLVEQMARVVDEAYVHIKPFIK
jgi:hypothetical protein